MSMDAPVEISPEEYQLQCDVRLQESFKKILVERDIERDVFRVSWRCWPMLQDILPTDRFPIAEFQAMAELCAGHGYHLIEKVPPTKQQKAFKKLQQLCQHIQSALWSGLILQLGLTVGVECLRVSELHAWDYQTIVCCVKTPQGEAAPVRYFFVPAKSSAFSIKADQPEPFMLRVLADPRMATVLL